MRAALQYLINSDMPAEHKAVLLDALTGAMRTVEDAHVHRQASGQASGQWHAHEIAQLQTFLQGKTANSWQQADERTTSLAARMRRSPQDIRAKASELGLGEAVDYQLAKAHARRPDE
jgi:hypothetical protein